MKEHIFIIILLFWIIGVIFGLSINDNNIDLLSKRQDKIELQIKACK